MTNTYVPTLGRNPLYCVWVETGDKRHTLTRVWIDPEPRGCHLVSTEAASASETAATGAKL
ncbi:MAG TPA: hypothetical protein VEI01_25850 [Terriglobales bacterium]|nr:hypothetical protein [Terriglobales bacterium]